MTASGASHITIEQKEAFSLWNLQPQRRIQIRANEHQGWKLNRGNICFQFGKSNTHHQIRGISPNSRQAVEDQTRVAGTRNCPALKQHSLNAIRRTDHGAGNELRPGVFEGFA